MQLTILDLPGICHAQAFWGNYAGVLGWDVPLLNCPLGHVVLGPAVPQDNLS